MAGYLVHHKLQTCFILDGHSQGGGGVGGWVGVGGGGGERGVADL